VAQRQAARPDMPGSRVEVLGAPGLPLRPDKTGSGFGDRLEVDAIPSSTLRDLVRAAIERNACANVGRCVSVSGCVLAPHLATASMPLGRLADEAPVQFLCEDLDLASQIGVGFELQFLSSKVVVGFGLLEGGFAVLADHDERRQEYRFE